MSVVSVTFQGWSVDGEENAGVRTYTADYRVLVNSPTDTVSTVLAASGLPVYNDAHPDDAAARVKRRRARRFQAPADFLNWEVTVSYSTSTATVAPDPDPVERKPQISVESEPHETVASYDNAGARIANSAGDVYDPPLMRPRSRMVISITRAEDADTIDFDDLEALYDTVNSDSVTIAGVSLAARQGYMRRISATGPHDDAPETYYWVTYEIVVANRNSPATGGDTAVPTNNHDAVVLDQGYRELIGGLLVPILDPATNLPITVPGNLIDGVYQTDPTDYEYRAHEIYLQAAWSGLGLPTTADP